MRKMGRLSYLFSIFKGKNLSGRVGLFPETYTTAAPPSTGPPPPSAASAYSEDSGATPESSTLQPLREEPETPPTNDDHATPNGKGHISQLSQGDGEVMKATMTDVQKAIEQLGKNGSSVRDDARSFSFASTRTGGDGDLTDRETDTDMDMDTDRETDAGGDDWHRDARQKLAEQARIVVEEQKKKEEEDTPVVRTVEPPIEVEMSDESEGEEDEDDRHHTHHSMNYGRAHPHIPEEDEDEEERRQDEEPQLEGSNSSSSQMPGDFDVPSADESALPTATASRTAFPIVEPVTTTPPNKSGHASATSLPTPTSDSGSPSTMPVAEPQPEHIVSPVFSFPEKSPQVTPTPSRVNDALAGLPSPPSSSIGKQQTSKHSSVASGKSLQPPPPEQNSSSSKKATHPTEWTVEEVVDWLKTKGFGDDVTEKFIGMVIFIYP